MSSNNAPNDIAFTGRCQCGAVGYSSTSPPQNITYCYCTTCRRLSGAPFIAWADIPYAAFQLDPQSMNPESCALQPVFSAVAVRSTCKNCGSPITMKYFCDEPSIGVAMGTAEEGSLADRAEVGKVTEHIFVGEKAGWFDLPQDGVQRWEGFSDGFEKKLESWKKRKEEGNSGGRRES